MRSGHASGALYISALHWAASCSIDRGAQELRTRDCRPPSSAPRDSRNSLASSSSSSLSSASTCRASKARKISSAQGYVCGCRARATLMLVEQHRGAVGLLPNAVFRDTAETAAAHRSLVVVPWSPSKLAGKQGNSHRRRFRPGMPITCAEMMMTSQPSSSALVLRDYRKWQGWQRAESIR